MPMDQATVSSFMLMIPNRSDERDSRANIQTCQNLKARKNVLGVIPTWGFRPMRLLRALAISDDSPSALFIFPPMRVYYRNLEAEDRILKGDSVVRAICLGSAGIFIVLEVAHLQSLVKG